MVVVATPEAVVVVSVTPEPAAMTSARTDASAWALPI
jgi:hypothetical protein